LVRKFERIGRARKQALQCAGFARLDCSEEFVGTPHRFERIETTLKEFLQAAYPRDVGGSSGQTDEAMQPRARCHRVQKSPDLAREPNLAFPVWAPSRTPVGRRVLLRREFAITQLAHRCGIELLREDFELHCPTQRAQCLRRQQPLQGALRTQYVAIARSRITGGVQFFKEESRRVTVTRLAGEISVSASQALCLPLLQLDQTGRDGGFRREHIAQLRIACEQLAE